MAGYGRFYSVISLLKTRDNTRNEFIGIMCTEKGNDTANGKNNKCQSDVELTWFRWINFHYGCLKFKSLTINRYQSVQNIRSWSQILFSQITGRTQKPCKGMTKTSTYILIICKLFIIIYPTTAWNLQHARDWQWHRSWF